jgi:hypothetical protein
VAGFNSGKGIFFIIKKKKTRKEGEKKELGGGWQC